MRILIVQMTRMGDVIQTTPLIRALKQNRPDSHITVVVRGMGKAIAHRNPDIDDIVIYDEEQMFRQLRAEDTDKLLRAYKAAEDYIHRIKDLKFDVAYNCTHSIASAMLLKLAEVSNVVGAHLSDDWQFVLRGRWVNYFFASVFNRAYSSLNLCDIVRHFAPGASASSRRLVLEVTEHDREFAGALLNDCVIGSEDFLVCLQLGASEQHKRWPEANFAALAKLLVEKRNAKILLLGVKVEGVLGEVFERYAPGVAVPLYGKTTISQAAALLERARVLVTNDTGTMHIAAAVNCPTILVSVGTVHFRETGPYGAGHCAIERHRAWLGPVSLEVPSLDERSRIRPDQVLEAIDVTLASDPDRPVASMEGRGAYADVGLFMSRFAPDGCLDWYPVVRRPITETDLMRIAYRAMWLDFMHAQADKGTERESVSQMLRCHSISERDEIDTCCSRLATAFEELASLTRRGIRQTDKLLEHLKKSKSMREAKEFVADLVRLDEEIRVFGEVHAHCKPLVLIARFERDNLEGAEPIPLAETTLEIYRDLYARARLMRQKLQRIAALCESIHT